MTDEGPITLPEWVQARRERWRARFFASWGIIGILVLVAAAGWLAWYVRAALWPVLIAAIITLLLLAPVGFLQRRGIGRGWAILLIYLVGVGVLVGVGMIVGPVLAKQLAAFAVAVPIYSAKVEVWIESVRAQYATWLVVPVWAQAIVRNVLSSLGGVTVGLANRAGSFLLNAGSSFVTAVIDLVLGLILAFWITKDLPSIYGAAREIVGHRYADDLDLLLLTVRHTVGGYLRGQTIASLITGGIALVGLALLGVPFALLLAVLVALLNYIPYVGPFIGGLVAATVALFGGGPWIALGAILVVVAAQQLTDNLITPRVMSEQVDLHPALVIFSLLVGGSLFGIVGMLVAIPFAATLKGLAVYYWERREHHPLSGPIEPPEEACADTPSGG